MVREERPCQGTRQVMVGDVPMGGGAPVVPRPGSSEAEGSPAR